MDKFEKRDDAKEHLIQSGFLSAHSRNPHTESASQTAHDYWIRLLTT